MRKNAPSQSGVFNPRVLLALVLSSGGVLLAMLSFAATPPSGMTRLDANSRRDSLFDDKHAGSLSGNANAAAVSDWSIVPSPNTNAAQNNYLNSVTCTSALDCWAVGYYQTDASNLQTLILRWNGTSWAIVPSPNPNPLPSQNTLLTGVTCTSATDCWAVGYSYDLVTVQTLILRWDGTSWAIVPSPNVTAAESNFLQAVTCVSASDCWAVGNYYGGNVIMPGANQTLILRWDGTSWTIVPSPSTATPTNLLYGVTCASPSDCWAVGQSIDTSGIRYQTLIERWNGASWAIVPSPNPPNPSSSSSNTLTGVTCVSASDCWIVGYNSDPVANHTLILRWDGISWAIVTSPNTSATQANVLNGVTCVSASECWAVGHDKVGSAYQTLIEGWDGISWTIVSSSNTAAQTNLLFGVTCVSASDCWAVGQYSAGGAYQTLIERYTPSPPPPIPTSVVSRKAHGTAGTFDINLPLAGNPGIECRTGGSAGNHQIVVTFPNAVTCNSAQVIIGIGRVSSFSVSGDGTQVTVNLTNVGNAQGIVVTLNISDGTTTGDIAVPMSVLLGDTTANGSVNSSDISQTKAQSGTVATSSNFRTDVTVNGLINSSDISTVKSKSGTALP